MQISKQISQCRNVPLVVAVVSCWLFLQFNSPVASAQESRPLVTDRLPQKIAFGSCSSQEKPQPILKTIVEQNPDLFIYLGDNIYGDTKDMEVLQAKYDKLAAKPEFENLRANVPLLSVWDDHDYGWNDAGKEYPFKAESKEIFMDFWKVPEDSPRRTHSGIYGSHQFTDGDKTVQVILLDTRTFRDPLKRNNEESKKLGFKNAYQPDDAEAKTLLGEDQWSWLETVLKKPADLRIVCSSIQFGHAYNGWESWTNLPREQERMFKLIRDTGANGVMFISGDVHWAEINKRQPDGLYPIFDVTASGINQEWYNVEPSEFRVGKAYREHHFGVLEIDWSKDDPIVVQKILGLDGTVKIKNEVPLSTLQSKTSGSQTPNELPELSANDYRLIKGYDEILARHNSFETFLIQGAAKAEAFRLSFVADNNAEPKSHTLERLAGQFADEKASITDFAKKFGGISLDAESKLDADEIYGPFEGQWFGRWSDFDVDHHWSEVVQPNPPISFQVEGSNSVYHIVAFQYAWIGDGYGVNLLTHETKGKEKSSEQESSAQETNQHLLGYVEHIKDGDFDQVTARRPHVAVCPEQGKLIWATERELFFESAELAIEGPKKDLASHYSIGGFRYQIEPTRFVATESFQTTYSRDASSRTNFIGAKIQLEEKRN